MSTRRRGANSTRGKGVGVHKINANKNNPDERGSFPHNSDSDGPECETVVYICHLCNENVNEDDQAVECNWCKNWEHAKCAGLLDGGYNMVGKGPKNLMWFCSDCQPQVGITLRFFNQVRVQHDQMDKRITEVEDTTKVVETKVNSVEKSVEKLNERLDSMDDTVDKVIDLKMEEMMAEEKDKQKRSKNIIVHGIKESSETSEEKKHDAEKIQDIISDKLGIQDVEIDNVVRLGKRNDEAVHPRLVKVVLKSQDKKMQILRKSKELKNHDEDDVKKVFIVPDMTPKEREKDKALRKELYERRDKGENDLFIREGKILKRRVDKRQQSGENLSQTSRKEI